MSLCLAVVSVWVQSGSATIEASLDLMSTQPISPYIYGVNFPDWDKLGKGITVARIGGNRMSAYNWETNASNAGNDWHHQNDAHMGQSDESGWTLRQFLEAAQLHGAAAIITIPTMGWVAADKKGDGDVAGTPNYLQTRFLRSIAKKGEPFQYPPDKTDRAVYQDECVAWLLKIASPKTPVWFSLDNEPDLWGSTHVRVWKQNPTVAQIIANNVEFAAAIKAVGPKALVFGPASYGWNGYRTFQGAPDVGDKFFLETYLAGMKRASETAGRRLLDVLDVHWYPEARGDGKRVTEEGDTAGLAQARIQAPRSLWDPTYVESSWITQSLGDKPIALLPLLKGMIDRNYPGTKLAVTEYNYGGGKTISGAIAQADVLGLFGRYGVFAACNWGISPGDVGQLAGFRAFRDFDGAGKAFGDIGVSVGKVPSELASIYAALDSKVAGRLTIVLINKSADSRTFHVLIPGRTLASARSWVVDRKHLGSPVAGQVTLGPGSLTVPSSPLSVTSVELTMH